MTLTVLAVALLGMVGGVTWAGTALAQGTLPTPEGAQGAAFVLPPQLEEPEPGVCGVGLVSDTTPGFVGDSLLRVLEIQPGTSQLGSSLGVASFSADTVAPPQLPPYEPPSPAGWERISCGILTSGVSTVGGPVAIFRRGPTTCFPVPDEFASANLNKIFYYDPSPGIQRWVGLITIFDADNQESCTSLRLPALLALFGLPA
jgi:hypothetical protein